MKILLIGNGAREHVIAETLKKNKDTKLFSYLKSKNPGIISLSEEFETGNYADLEKIKSFALRIKPDFAFIGPEEPLNNGVADLLSEIGITSVGPTKSLARLETSKSFTRNLLRKYKIEGNPKFEIFDKNNLDDAKKFIEGLGQCVIKPDGLTGGKGVKVQGDHFQTKKEAFDYCSEVLQSHSAVVVEEKLEGEEFSLQCLTDGKTVIATPPVQDHKRAFAGDKGPNTGGMGSYSCENHLLPFLTKKDVEDGLKITQKAAEALHKETGEFYKGVMYAGLIVTKNGIKLLEYNARLGDPEAMNILPLMETDFAEVCNAIINQELHKVRIKFHNNATVCKYLVPEGYPGNPLGNEKIEIKKIPQSAGLYYASVEQKEDGIYTTSSRAIACLGISDNLEKAEKIAEEATKSISGKLFHRKDIGTNELIEKRVRHMKNIGNKNQNI
ncbi:phosphoribosylamine--glycine ligase [Candidatus Woesearchaeota archaeon]|nr:phosphoribosylamine--glycine ligase [Candidatus Woesearchaeota archaeon]